MKSHDDPSVQPATRLPGLSVELIRALEQRHPAAATLFPAAGKEPQ